MSADRKKGSSTVLGFFFRHCDILPVCLIPQKGPALYLKTFSLSAIGINHSVRI